MEGSRSNDIIRTSKKTPFSCLRRESVYASGINVCSLMSPVDRSYWPMIVIVAGADRLPASSTAMTV